MEMCIWDEIHVIWDRLLEIFNTRELANLFWIMVAFCLGMASTSMRGSIFGVIKKLLTWKLILIYITAFVYIALVVLILERIGLWNQNLLKDTIYWAILSGLTLMYDIALSKEPLSILKKNLITSVQFSVIIQFISNLNTFNFWIEFLAVPIIFLFASIYVFSQYRKEHAPVRNLLSKVGTALSIVAFGYVVYFAITNYHKYIHIETLKQFLLPIILTASFTPLLAVLNLIVQYEEVASSLKRRARSKSQYRYMLMMGLFYFNFNIKGLIRWRLRLNSSDTENKQTIKASMKRIRQQQQLEEVPPKYPDLEGWRPEYAKSFLINCACEISSYQSELGDVWIGKSNKLKLDEDFMTADCTYTIRGTKYVVNHIQLHLQMFDPARIHDVEKFIKVADTLYNNALYEAVSGN